MLEKKYTLDKCQNSGYLSRVKALVVGSVFFLTSCNNNSDSDSLSTTLTVSSGRTVIVESMKQRVYDIAASWKGLGDSYENFNSASDNLSKTIQDFPESTKNFREAWLELRKEMDRWKK